MYAVVEDLMLSGVVVDFEALYSNVHRKLTFRKIDIPDIFLN